MIFAVFGVLLVVDMRINYSFFYIYHWQDGNDWLPSLNWFKVQPLRSTRFRSSSAARVWCSRTHRSCTVTRSDTLCRPHSRQTRLQYQRVLLLLATPAPSGLAITRLQVSSDAGSRFHVVTHWLLQRCACRVSESHHSQPATDTQRRGPCRHRNIEIRPWTDWNSPQRTSLAQRTAAGQVQVRHYDMNTFIHTKPKIKTHTNNTINKTVIVKLYTSGKIFYKIKRTYSSHSISR